MTVRVSPTFRGLPVAPVASTSQQGTARKGKLKDVETAILPLLKRSFLRIERATEGLAMPGVDPAVRRILGHTRTQDPELRDIPSHPGHQPARLKWAENAQDAECAGI